MKATEVKSEQDILNFIEGTLNDFESGLSDKHEAIENIIELLDHLQSLSIQNLL